MRGNIVCRNVKMQREGAFPGFSPLLNCHLINYRPFILRLTCWASLSTSVSPRSLVSHFSASHCLFISSPPSPPPPSSLSVSLSLWWLCSPDTLWVLSLPVKWNGRVSLPFCSANSQLPIRRYNGVRKNKLLQLTASVCVHLCVCASPTYFNAHV